MYFIFFVQRLRRLDGWVYHHSTNFKRNIHVDSICKRVDEYISRFENYERTVSSRNTRKRYRKKIKNRNVVPYFVPFVDSFDEVSKKICLSRGIVPFHISCNASVLFPTKTYVNLYLSPPQLHERRFPCREGKRPWRMFSVPQFVFRELWVTSCDWLLAIKAHALEAATTLWAIRFFHWSKTLISLGGLLTPCSHPWKTRGAVCFFTLLNYSFQWITLPRNVLERNLNWLFQNRVKWMRELMISRKGRILDRSVEKKESMVTLKILI